MMNVDKIQVRVDGHITNPDEFKFDMICQQCGGHNVRVTPVSYYETNNKVPDKVTMFIRCCDCGNEIEYIVYFKNA